MLQTPSVDTNAAPASSAPGGPHRARWGAIVVCGMPFDGDPPFSDTHLPRALSRRCPVLVVDTPQPVHKARRLHPELDQLDERLWRLRPLTPPGPDRPGWARLSDPVLGHQVERAASSVLPTTRALVTFSPARGLLEQVSRALTVYWRRDAPAHANYVRSVAHERRRHERMLAAADVVIAVSPPLAEDSLRHERDVVLLPNGADVAHFAAPPVTDPPSLAGDGRRAPVVGYLGAVSWRLDTELIDHIAKARPRWRIVLVGKVSAAMPERRNVEVVGPVPWAEAPRWTQAFDVGLVPYRVDAFNRSSFPLKVFDYLASGRAVVSTPLPGLEGFDPCIRLADDADGFVAAVEAALHGRPTPAECRSLAASNSWDQRAADLHRLLSEHLTT